MKAQSAFWFHGVFIPRLVFRQNLVVLNFRFFGFGLIPEFVLRLQWRSGIRPPKQLMHFDHVGSGLKPDI